MTELSSVDCVDSVENQLFTRNPVSHLLDTGRRKAVKSSVVK